jgi:Stage II sporulation protein M
MALLNSSGRRADAHEVSVNDLVLVHGMRDTKLALTRWNRQPFAALRPWCVLSLAIAAALLFAVYAVAKFSTPDQTIYDIPGYNVKATLADYGHVLFRNSLVLALHALACVAGFMAGSSLPLSASHRSGLSRWVHEKAGPLAIAFVVCATLFSLCTQAYVLGGDAAALAGQVGTSPGALVLARLPHALPELFALFLPLAAWMIASRRDDWHELLAATFVTVAVAVPILLAAAAVEVWVSPHLLHGLGN